MLATHRRRTGEHSCLQFASSGHNVASEVTETFCVLYIFSIDMNYIVVLFYFYFRTNKKVKDVPHVCL